MVVNEDRFFLSHRKDIALGAQKEGYDVSIVCKDTGQFDEVKALGLKVYHLPINPTGMNMKEEMKTMRFLYKFYKLHKPDIVHHVGLKNIMWGGVAAKYAKVPCVVNAVSGLGVLFNGIKPSTTAKGVMHIMAFSNRGKNVAEIFQNSEDKSLFIKHKVIPESQCVFIKGSGVSLDEYCYTEEPSEGKIKVMFTARMVKEKGMITLIDAAEQLREKYQDKVEFLLCGGLSNNPNGIKKHELEAMCDGVYIKWLGHRKDVLRLLKQCHIVAFPSYYREGVPRSLIEACAVGRPIITCDSIGCKDVVTDGENGFLIQPQDHFALAERLSQLIENKELRQSMGRKGRLVAENEFSVNRVVEKHLEIYRNLLAKKK